MTRLFPTLMAIALAAPAAYAADGHLDVRRLSGPLLVAAPHGDFDLHTDGMARQIALLADASYLLASGFRTTADPVNVNRPTVGVGLAAKDERETAEARAVYKRWEGEVVALAPALYVEIHGNSRKESAGALEVATQGLDLAAALRFEAAYKRHAATIPGALPMLIEPRDRLHYAASGVKTRGVLRRVGRAIHVETPRSVRFEEKTRSRYASALALALLDFLAP